MIKITFYIALVLIVVAGFAWMADHPGNVTIVFEGLELTTSLAALAGVGALLVIFAMMLLYCWIWFRTDAPFFGKNRIYKRQRQGLDYLNQSLVALATGDTSSAKRLIKNAELLLPPQPMIHLLAAETAIRDGDHVAATRHYHELEQDNKARFLGLRGLISEARRTGQTAQALELAKKALQEKGKSHWVLDTIFQLEIAAGDWEASQNTLKKLRKMNFIPKDTADSHDAALLYAQAIEQSMRGDISTAKKSLLLALKKKPGFVAAASQLARIEEGADKKNKAEKVLADAYKHNPHQDLLSTLLNFNRHLTDEQWRDKIHKFVAAQLEQPVSLFALAEAELACDHLKECRVYLDRLLKRKPTRAAWLLMAQLIDAEGGDSQNARDKRNAALPDPSWECEGCGQNLTAWFSICPACNSFDSISWSDHSFDEQGRNKEKIAVQIPLTLLKDTALVPSATKE